MLKHLYLGLVFCRFILVFSPGYLHPDEFMQSVEVSAGEMLRLPHYRAWEFNETSDVSNRIRSVVGVHLVSVFVFGPLRLLESMGLLDLRQVSGEWLSAIILYGPRLVQCVMSLLVDYAVAQSSIYLFRTVNVYEVLVWTSSSYVALAFLNRTFSNSLECVFFMLFWLHSYKFLRSSRAEAERVLRGESADLIRYRNLHIATVAFCLAFFVRPTFLLFSLVPLLSVALRGQLIALRVRPVEDTLRNIVGLFLTAICTCMSCILLDTKHYQAKSSSSLWQTLCNRDEWVITPVNFALYNVNSSNLASHGTHEKWTHALVNLPLLLGPSYILLLLAMFRTGNETAERRLLRQSVLFPIAAFSAFSHQEARFLLALMPICGLLTFSELRRLHRHVRKLLLLFWLLFNLLVGGFYCYAHQAGLAKVTADFGSVLKHAEQANVDVYFVRTYPVLQSALHAHLRDFERESGAQVHLEWLLNLEQLKSRLLQRHRETLVVLPAVCEALLRATLPAGVSSQTVATYATHVTLDEDVDWRKLDWSKLTLNVYKLVYTYANSMKF